MPSFFLVLDRAAAGLTLDAIPQMTACQSTAGQHAECATLDCSILGEGCPEKIGPRVYVFCGRYGLPFFLVYPEGQRDAGGRVV